MFISKWKYEMKLDAARLQGMRAGRAEAVREYHDMVKKLEDENARLEKQNAAQWDENKTLWTSLENAKHDLEHAYKDLSAMQSLLEQQAEVTIPKSTVVRTMANELACCQRIADKRFYEDGDQEGSSMMLMQASAIKDLASELGVCGEVYAFAYQIYDFRNSGKAGYTLKDGKIVKVEEENQEHAAETHAEEAECPFPEEETAEPAEETDAAAEEMAVCDPNQAEDSCQASGCEAE